MARSEMVVVLPLVVYVDDNALIAPESEPANREMRALQHWASSPELGAVAFKELKDRSAAQRQLYIGFWWDSLSQTRTLEEKKLLSYVAQLLHFSAV